MLAEADEIVMDDTFLTTVVQPCLRENGLPNALPVLYRILEHRAHEIDSHTTPPTLRWHPNDRDAPAIIAMGDLCVDVLSKYPTVHVDNSDDDQKRIMHNLLHLVRAMPATDSARAICKRVAELVQSHGEEWFRWVLNGDIVSRLHELSSGPNSKYSLFMKPTSCLTLAVAFILEFVARDWLKGLHFSDALVHFNKIFEPQLLLVRSLTLRRTTESLHIRRVE